MVVKAKHNLVKFLSINHKADVHKRRSLRDHIHIAFLQWCKRLLEHTVKSYDILSDDRVKIIDYKTGNEKFDISEAEAGYRLQLMLYLEASRLSCIKQEQQLIQ